jgi:hypothetical protein
VTRVAVGNVLAFRLERHRLERRAGRGELIEIVPALCGIHAQLISSADLDALTAAERERRGGRLEAKVEPFGRLTAPTRRAIAEEVERLATFLGAPAGLSVAA